jgi:DNA invertase Pin-like site-specific DNA recombinase
MLLSQTRDFENLSPVSVNIPETPTSSLSKTVLKWYSQSTHASTSFNKDPAPQRNFIMLIGYARVSTQDQNLELQTEALTKAGCKKIFEDKVTGSRAERPGLTKTQEALREGDTLVVWKLDRLGRSVKNLVDLVEELHKKGVQFKSLTDAIDTGTPSGRFFFHVMASLAQMERELTIERTRAGLDIARKLGRKGGRKRQMTDSKIKSAKKLLASGVPPRDVATNLGVSVPTLYRWIPASTMA